MTRTDSDPNLRPVQQEFDELAAHYERRWHDYVTATTSRTLQHVTRRPGAHILDLGCGPGPLLRGIEQAVPTARSVGLDLSIQMLRMARRQVTAGTHLVAGDVARLPFRARVFDGVVSSSSLHFWRHPAKALGEIARVLKPGGELVITDWCDDFLACRLCDRFLRLVNRAHHRIYGSRECVALLEATGFEVRALDRYKINWLWGLMTAVAAQRAA